MPQDTEDALLMLRLFRGGDIAFVGQTFIHADKRIWQHPYRILTDVASTRLLTELDRLGISFSTIYPDMTGLAKELKSRFRLFGVPGPIRVVDPLLRLSLQATGPGSWRSPYVITHAVRDAANTVFHGPVRC